MTQYFGERKFVLTHLALLLQLLLFWLIVFWIQRLAFLLFFGETYRSFHPVNWLLSFVHGFALDLSAACYLLVIPVLMLTVQQFTRKNFYRGFLYCYAGVMLLLISFISVFDMGIYHDWKTHLNYRAIHYLQFVNEAAAFSDSGLNLVLAGILFIQLALGMMLVFFFFGKKNFRFPWSSFPFSALTFHLLLLVVLFLGMRGGMQLIPVNESSAYYSSERKLNDAAINITWNAVKKWSDGRESMAKNPFHSLPEAEAEKLMTALYSESPDTAPDVLTSHRPNIVLFILESFTSDVIASLNGEPGVTPFLDSLISDGLLFTQLYSSGFRTDQGIASIFSGWPATPNFSILLQTEKHPALPFLPLELKKAGYHTSFFYGGESSFANMKAYFMEGGIDQLIDRHEFSRSEMSAKWGAHDEYVFSRQARAVNQFPSPFFSVVLSLSNHEPFETPTVPKFPGTDFPSRFKNTSYYTDQCLAAYFREVQDQPWYSNTLFIVVADHGHTYPKNRAFNEAARFHIPLIFFGEVVKHGYRGKKISAIGMQSDLPATLLAQLGIDTEKFSWSRNLLNPSTKNFAYYTFDSGFGWITSGGQLKFPFEKNSADYFSSASSGGSADQLEARAFLQTLYSQFILF